MRVEVYRNLRTGTWSVRVGGRVVDHPDEITLKNCTFAVQPAGNRKVREEGRKNVHAFVRGDLVNHRAISELYRENSLWRPVTYNPYKHQSFVDAETGQPVYEALHVSMDVKHGVYYIP